MQQHPVAGHRVTGGGDAPGAAVGCETATSAGPLARGVDALHQTVAPPQPVAAPRSRGQVRHEGHGAGAGVELGGPAVPGVVDRLEGLTGRQTVASSQLAGHDLGPPAAAEGLGDVAASLLGAQNSAFELAVASGVDGKLPGDVLLPTAEIITQKSIHDLAVRSLNLKKSAIVRLAVTQ